MILKDLIEQRPDYASQIETRLKQIYAPFFDTLVSPEKLQKLIKTIPVSTFLTWLRVAREDCCLQCSSESKLKTHFLEDYDRQITEIEDLLNLQAN